MKEDHYARHSTVMSNERTLLAYIRTSLTFFIAGISFISIFKDELVIAVGTLFVFLGFLLLTVGIIRFFQTKTHLNKIK